MALTFRAIPALAGHSSARKETAVGFLAPAAGAVRDLRPALG